MKTTPRVAEAGFAGAMIIALLLLFGGAFTVWFVTRAGDAAEVERQIRTREALALARDALITFAASNPDRGYLPCPAQPPPNQPGIAEGSCGAHGLRIGRLPWRTLQLPDLRDGNGDALWYAVSEPFTNDQAKINSAISVGTLSIDGQGGVVAIVFSPGKILEGQSRAAALEHCTTIGSNLRADYCAANFLDVNSATSVANGDANTSFTRGAGGQFNDQLLSISAAEVLPKMEARVLSEVKNCLLAYSNAPGNTAHRFPWARQDGGDPLDVNATYAEVLSAEIGRIPDTLVDDPLTTGVDESGFWSAHPHCPLPRCAVTGACTANKNWLKDWRDLLYYVVSIDAGVTAGVTVNTPAATTVKAAILMAGPTVGSQSRADATEANTPSNYLEGSNLTTYADPTKVWETTSTSPPFNDQILVVAP